MELNGVNSNRVAYEATATSSNKAKSSSSSGKSASTSAYSDVAATYESSSVASKSSSKTVKVNNPDLVAQLKADQQTRMNQLQNLVTEMFSKQGKTFATTDDMWKALADGNFTADPETIAKAKEDISEDGYWGVKQTSERIFSFAQALAGDNEELMTKMKAAVEKGFKEATKVWGKDLPDITNNTYDAVMKKFDDFFESKKTSTDMN